MHIAIDITPLSTGHKDRGIGSYTKLLIEALQKYEPTHTYTLFTRTDSLPKNVDLVHYPYFDPFFLTLPLYKTLPTVVTVHDLIPLVYPDKFPPGIKGRIKWEIQRFSLQGASRVITDSMQSKEDVIRLTHVSRDKIDVVYLAPGGQFRRMDHVKDKKTLEKVAKKYHVPKDFILYVGDVNWNKNIAGLLKAFEIVKSSFGKASTVSSSTVSSESNRSAEPTQDKQKSKQDIALVLVGKVFTDGSLPEVKEIKQLITQLNLAEDVRMIGFVPEEDLVAIYNLATVYVQPSIYEGFGLPVLEAMSSGCPVVCSYAASLTEIGGPSISIDPFDPVNIASGLEQVLGMNKNQQSRLVREELDWVKKFSWKSVAAQTVASYEKALA